MEFRTPVTIDKSPFAIAPCERMLFVGSCFADNIGSRFVDDKFRATVNPYGVMYNPASILHTVERYLAATTAEVARTAVFTLGTNRVYILNETGEIVDNCQKRPQRLFTERSLSVDECAEYITKAIDMLRERRADVRIVLTVSPIPTPSMASTAAPCRRLRCCWQQSRWQSRPRAVSTSRRTR